MGHPVKPVALVRRRSNRDCAGKRFGRSQSPFRQPGIGRRSRPARRWQWSCSSSHSRSPESPAKSNFFAGWTHRHRASLRDADRVCVRGCEGVGDAGASRADQSRDFSLLVHAGGNQVARAMKVLRHAGLLVFALMLVARAPEGAGARATVGRVADASQAASWIRPAGRRRSPKSRHHPAAHHGLGRARRAVAERAGIQGRVACRTGRPS